MNRANETTQQNEDSVKIISLLEDIQEQNSQIVNKIDGLESKVTKKAVVYGAMSGGFTATMLEIGIELIKAKFGG